MWKELCEFREDRILIGRISHIFSRIEFGLRCITTVMVIDLSKKPILGLDLLEHTLQDPLTFIIRDLISACDGKIGAMSVRFQEQELMQDSLLMLIDSFECCNEGLNAHILTNVPKMVKLKSLSVHSFEELDKRFIHCPLHLLAASFSASNLTQLYLSPLPATSILMIAQGLPSSSYRMLQISQSDFSDVVTLEGLLNSVANSEVVDLDLFSNNLDGVHGALIADAL
jgi:hypothetical protein